MSDVRLERHGRRAPYREQDYGKSNESGTERLGQLGAIRGVTRQTRRGTDGPRTGLRGRHGKGAACCFTCVDCGRLQRSALGNRSPIYPTSTEPILAPRCLPPCGVMCARSSGRRRCRGTCAQALDTCRFNIPLSTLSKPNRVLPEGT